MRRYGAAFPQTSNPIALELVTYLHVNDTIMGMITCYTSGVRVKKEKMSIGCGSRVSYLWSTWRAIIGDERNRDWDRPETSTRTRKTWSSLKHYRRIDSQLRHSFSSISPCNLYRPYLPRHNRACLSPPGPYVTSQHERTSILCRLLTSPFLGGH